MFPCSTSKNLAPAPKEPGQVGKAGLMCHTWGLAPHWLTYRAPLWCPPRCPHVHLVSQQGGMLDPNFLCQKRTLAFSITIFHLNLSQVFIKLSEEPSSESWFGEKHHSWDANYTSHCKEFITKLLTPTFNSEKKNNSKK